MKTLYNRIFSSAKSALPKSKKTVWWLLKIILPISLGVSLLQYWGFIEILANFLSPVFSYIGLPGEAAIVFISSIFLSLYAPIAILATLPLEMREITILALMCLITHNMIVECAVQRKTGSSYLGMFVLRIATSFIAAFIVNLFLPEDMGKAQVVEQVVEHQHIGQMLWYWLIGAAWLILKITLIVTGLMILQNILKEFKIMQLLARIFAPMMKIFGLSKESSFMWFVGQILGLTYGSAVMIDQVQQNEISKKDANQLNYHLAINHSLLEDTLLFVAIGVPGIWLIAPRFVLAIVAVWLVRLFTEYLFISKNSPSKTA